MATYEKALAAYNSGQMAAEDPAKAARFKAALDAGAIAPVRADKAFREYAAGNMDGERAARFQAALEAGRLVVSPHVIDEVNRAAVLAERDKIEAAQEPYGAIDAIKDFGQGFASEIGPAFKDAAVGLARGAGKYAIAYGTAGQPGLATVAAQDLVFDPMIQAANFVTGSDFKTSEELFQQLATDAGLPEPKMIAGRLMRSFSQLASGGPGASALSKTLSTGGKTAQAVSRGLRADVAADTVSGGISGVASQGVAEMGGGPAAQFFAGALAGPTAYRATQATGRGRPVLMTDVDEIDTVKLAEQEALKRQAAEQQINARKSGIRQQAAGERAAIEADAAELARVDKALDDAAQVNLESSEDAINAAARRLGRAGNRQVIAEQVRPDPEKMAAAERLGFGDLVHPDHVSTNEAYKDLAQLAKAQPGSKTKADEIEKLTRIAGGMVEIVNDISGGLGPSRTAEKVRSSLERREKQLAVGANRLYQLVADGMKDAANRAGGLRRQTSDLSNTRAQLREFLRQADGNKQLLSGGERRMVANFLEGGKGRGPIKSLPYETLDSLRKGLTSARVKVMKKSPYSSIPDARLRALENAVMADQRAIIEATGPDFLKLFDAAQRTSRVKFAARDDIKKLLGDRMEKSFTSQMENKIKNLPDEDVKIFNDFVKLIPIKDRKQAVASGLVAMLGTDQKSGNVSFKGISDWYKKMKRHPEAMSSLMSNLPEGSGQKIADMAKLSEGIASSLQKWHPTGRVTKESIEAVESVMGGLAKFVGEAGAVRAAQTVGGKTGGGAVSLLISRLSGVNASAVAAMDDFLSSAEFQRLAIAAGEPSIAGQVKRMQRQRAAARALAEKPSFRRFVKQVGNPRELSNPVNWLVNMVEYGRDTNPEAEQ